MGAKFSGKSSTANTILGNDEWVAITGVQGVTRIAARRLVTVIESYGWQKSMAEWIKCAISKSVKSCSDSPYAVLLVIQADTSFTKAKKSEVKEYMTCLDDSVLKRTIVLFTCGDWLGDTSIEQHIESEGEELQWLVEACGNRYHVFNNMIQGDETQVLELMEKIEQMLPVDGGHFFSKSLPNVNIITSDVSKPCLHNTKKWRLSDTECIIRDNQSIHHPPTSEKRNFTTFSLYTLCKVVYV